MKSQRSARNDFATLSIKVVVPPVVGGQGPTSIMRCLSVMAGLELGPKMPAENALSRQAMYRKWGGMHVPFECAHQLEIGKIALERRPVINFGVRVIGAVSRAMNEVLDLEIVD